MTTDASRSVLVPPRSRGDRVRLGLPERSHPVQDVTPEQGFPLLRVAAPRSEAAAEPGLVPEESVLDARLLPITRLLLPLPSADSVDPLKSRFSLPPRAVRGPPGHRGATRRDHDLNVLCTGLGNPIVDRPVVIGTVRRETPDWSLDLIEEIRKRAGVSLGAHQLGRAACRESV